TINYGERPGFTITVTNESAAPVAGVEFEDMLPTSPTGATWTMSEGVEECDLKNGTLTCSGIDLAPGKEFSVHVHHRIPSFNRCGMTLESAAALIAGGEGRAAASISVICPEPSISIEIENETVVAGDLIGVKVTY